MAVVLLHKGVEHVGHFVLLVVDNERDGGHWLVRLFSLLIALIISYGGKLVEQGDIGAGVAGQASSIGVYEIAVGKRAKAFIAEKL